MSFNKLKVISAAAILLVLAACQSTNEIRIKITSPEDFTPIQKALSYEFFEKGLSKNELKKLEKFATKNDFGITIYVFKNKKLSGKERLYCHMAFMPKKGTKRYRTAATRYENMSYEVCKLLVLRTLRPSAYQRILADRTLVTDKMKRDLQNW